MVYKNHYMGYCLLDLLFCRITIKQVSVVIKESIGGQMFLFVSSSLDRVSYVKQYKSICVKNYEADNHTDIVKYPRVMTET